MAGGDGGAASEAGSESVREPTLAGQHEREWAERKQKLDADLMRKLKDELIEVTEAHKTVDAKLQRLSKDVQSTKSRVDENEKRLKLSLRHTEEQLRTANELNAGQKAELSELRSRARKTDAVVGMNMPSGGLMSAGGADGEAAEEWEEKILELAEAEYTISQLKEKRKADGKKIKLLAAKVSSFESERGEQQGMVDYAQDLAAKLKQAKNTAAHKSKHLELKIDLIGRQDEELQTLRKLKALSASSNHTEGALQAENDMLRLKLAKSKGLLKAAKKASKAGQRGHVPAASGGGQLPGEFQGLHDELQGFINLLGTEVPAAGVEAS